MGSPRRRQGRRTLADPDALAAQLPPELSTFDPVPGSHHFHDHARRVAEWLNTQTRGLGYLTPQVMAAAGLTASAWFQRSLSARPTEEGVFAPQEPFKAPRALSIQEGQKVAQESTEGPERGSDHDMVDPVASSVYHPALLERPPNVPHGVMWVDIDQIPSV